MNNLIVNTNQNAQYSIAPFERKEIIIGATGGAAPNRVAGQLIPELEGTGFYVERADYPVLANFGHGMGGLESSINLRDGLEIDASFKGITLTHPLINVAAKLTLILLKNGVKLSNQLDDPVSRMNFAFRTISNTALLQSVGIFVFPGARSIKNLQAVVQAATTTTQVVASFIDAAGNTISAASNFTQQVGAVAAAYTQTGSAMSPNSALVIGPSTVYTFPTLFVPTPAVELQIAVIGTGLGLMSVAGNYE